MGYKGFPRGRPLVIIGPKGLPAPVQKRLETAFLKAMKEPVYAKYLDSIQFSPAFADGNETARNIEENSRIWAEFIRMTGIKEKAK